MNGNFDDRRGTAQGDVLLNERTPSSGPSEQPHSFHATNRQVMALRGITDVLGFDESAVFLVTTCGRLTLEGAGLHVTVLNLKDGVVEVTGKLYGLLYDDAVSDAGNADKHKGKRGLLGRLLS